MTQPPPLCLKRHERPPDLVLRASAHAAAPGEQEPVTPVEAAPDRNDEKNPCGGHRT
jgi:hypothetical protein